MIVYTNVENHLFSSLIISIFNNKRTQASGYKNTCSMKYRLYTVYLKVTKKVVNNTSFRDQSLERPGICCDVEIR